MWWIRKPEKNVALFDMDGSIADYATALAIDLLKISSPSDEVITPENVHDLPRSEHMKNRMELIKNQTGWWLGLEPIKNGMDILKLAAEVGFDIHILTKGPRSAPVAWKEKLEWCQKHVDPIVPDVDVHVTSDKGLFYGKVLYDDFPDYMTAWLEHRPRGLGIMPVTNSNKKFHHPNVIKYDGTNVQEVKQALEKSFNRKPGRKLWK